MFEIGRVCVKIAGRDAGKKCIIVDVIDKNSVMIDGETRRRKCGVRHLEATKQLLELEKGASNTDVVSVLKKAGIDIKEKKTPSEAQAKSEKKADKPKRARKAKIKPTQEKPTKEKPPKDKADKDKPKAKSPSPKKNI